jgi:hypothetical protein
MRAKHQRRISAPYSVDAAVLRRRFARLVQPQMGFAALHHPQRVATPLMHESAYSDHALFTAMNAKDAFRD